MAGRRTNPFEILRIGVAATDDEVKSAWRAAMFEAHPDQNPDEPDATARVAEVQWAFERLKTRDRREAAAVEYGMAVTAARSAMREDFDDLFRRLDDSAKQWNGRFAAGPADGAHLDRELTLTLEQAFRGGPFRIEHPAARCGGCGGMGRIHRNFPCRCPTCRGEGHAKAAEGMIRMKIECPTCVGRGKVTWEVCASCGGSGQVPGVSAAVEVPPGVATGFLIKLPGLGAPGVAGGRPGDLAVTLRVIEHRVFHRRGDDLAIGVRVPVWDAALGVRRRVRGIDGRTLEFEVPAGSRSGRVLSLRGEGMTTLDGRRGDLLVRLDVTVPAAGVGRMRELFEEMRREAARDGRDPDGAS